MIIHILADNITVQIFARQHRI